MEGAVPGEVSLQPAAARARAAPPGPRAWPACAAASSVPTHARADPTPDAAPGSLPEDRQTKASRPPAPRVRAARTLRCPARASEAPGRRALAAGDEGRGAAARPFCALLLCPTPCGNVDGDRDAAAEQPRGSGRSAARGWPSAQVPGWDPG